MRSRPIPDTWLGLLIAVLLVSTAAVGAVVIDRHAEQHGHCPPLAMLDVEFAQRLQRDHRQDVGEVVHAPQLACMRGAGA